MMVDIFAELDKKFNIVEKTNNLATCILTKDDFLADFGYKTFYDVFDDIFDMWPLNNNFINLDDILIELELLRRGNGDTIHFHLNDEQSCYRFLQFFKNAFNFALEYYLKNKTYINKIHSLINKLHDIANKANLQFVYFKDKHYYKLAEIKPLTKQIAQKQKPDIAMKMFEYQLIDNKNNVSNKKEILLTLAHETEAITKAYTKKSGDIYELYDNLDFALNNFNIRHNNIEGKNRKEFIVNLKESEMIELYDYTYDLIVAVLNQNATIDSLDKIKLTKGNF